MRIENDSYYFMKFNQARGVWSKYTERPFETESLTTDIEMSVRADSYEEVSLHKTNCFHISFSSRVVKSLLLRSASIIWLRQTISESPKRWFHANRLSRRRRGSERGFTLVEMLVAIAIISAVGIAVSTATGGVAGQV